MRIGLFTDSYVPRVDGIAISTEMFKKSLEDLGHEVYVLCPNRPEASYKNDQTIISTMSLPGMFYEGFRNAVPFTPSYTKKVQQLDLDVIHVMTAAQMGLYGSYISRKFNIPIISTCSSDINLISYYWWLKAGSQLIYSLNAVALRKNPLKKAGFAEYYNLFDETIAPSEKVATYLRSDGCESVSTIAWGVQKSFFSSKEKSRPRVVKFISTSRLVPEKRIDQIVQAFCHLEGDAELIIVGDGPEKPKLEKLAESTKSSIRFTGNLNRAELKQELSEASVLVSASDAETLGLVFNEAAAQGLAIIYSDKDVNPILVDGESAVLTDGSEESLRKTMQFFVDNPEDVLRYGRNAKKNALKMTEEVQNQKILTLYKKVISARSSK